MLMDCFKSDGKLTGAILFAVVLAFFVFGSAKCVVASDAGQKIFEFRVLDTRDIEGRFLIESGEKLTVDWGDGTTEEFGGGWQGFSKDYGSKDDNTVSIYSANESVLKRFYMVQAGVNIKFNVKDLPVGIEYLDVRGANTIAGDIADLPVSLVSFYCYGNNTVTGDIADLPEKLTHFHWRGVNTLKGDVGRLKGGLVSFFVLGPNSIRGDVKALPPSLRRFDVHGENTITGNIAEIPDGMENFDVRGKNTLSGNISGLPGTMSQFNCFGENTIKGESADFPEGLVRFYCGGANSLSGDIGSLPEGLTHFFCDGKNTLYGDIAELPAGIRHFDCRGLNSISTYTSGRNWAEVMELVWVAPTQGAGLSTTEVDNLLIDLAKNDWAGSRRIWLAGNNAPASSDSLGARKVLAEKAVRVEVQTEP